MSRQLASSLLLAVAVLAVGDLVVTGQDAARSKRFGAREGEVITKAARSERHADTLSEGQEAPDFTLADPAGKNEFTLSSHRGKRPVVLMFGSLTCPPFRQRIQEVDKLYEHYKDWVAFRFIYVREAHPGSKLHVVEDGQESLQTIEQTETLGERSRNARICTGTLKVQMPVVIDKEDNEVNKTYAGWPIRLVAVDTDGKLAYISGPGPGGFKPDELAQRLKANSP